MVEEIMDRIYKAADVSTTRLDYLRKRSRDIQLQIDAEEEKLGILAANKLSDRDWIVAGAGEGLSRLRELSVDPEVTDYKEYATVLAMLGDPDLDSEELEDFVSSLDTYPRNTISELLGGTV